MSNKPIEVGCRVMVVSDGVCPENVGKVAVVISEEISLPNYEKNPLNCRPWTISSQGGKFKARRSDGTTFYTGSHVFTEQCLIRLPDEDEVKEFDKEMELEKV